MKFNISTLDQLQMVAKQIEKNLQPGSVFALHGELGSGKTTFTQALIKLLGISHAVTSPTFNIINEYPWRDEYRIYHLDLYRIKSPKELTSLGLEELIHQGNNLIIIEWPELAEKVLPSYTKHFYFLLDDDGTRTLQIL